MQRVKHFVSQKFSGSSRQNSLHAVSEPHELHAPGLAADGGPAACASPGAASANRKSPFGNAGEKWQLEEQAKFMVRIGAFLSRFDKLLTECDCMHRDLGDTVNIFFCRSTELRETALEVVDVLATFHAIRLELQPHIDTTRRAVAECRRRIRRAEVLLKERNDAAHKLDHYTKKLSRLKSEVPTGPKAEDRILRNEHKLERASMDYSTTQEAARTELHETLQTHFISAAQLVSKALLLSRELFSAAAPSLARLPPLLGTLSAPTNDAPGGNGHRGAIALVSSSVSPPNQASFKRASPSADTLRPLQGQASSECGLAVYTGPAQPQGLSSVSGFSQTPTLAPASQSPAPAARALPASGEAQGDKTLTPGSRYGASSGPEATALPPVSRGSPEALETANAIPQTSGASGAGRASQGVVEPNASSSPSAPGPVSGPQGPLSAAGASFSDSSVLASRDVPPAVNVRHRDALSAQTGPLGATESASVQAQLPVAQETSKDRAAPIFYSSSTSFTVSSGPHMYACVSLSDRDSAPGQVGPGPACPTQSQPAGGVSPISAEAPGPPSQGQHTQPTAGPLTGEALAKAASSSCLSGTETLSPSLVGRDMSEKRREESRLIRWSSVGRSGITQRLSWGRFRRQLSRRQSVTGEASGHCDSVLLEESSLAPPAAPSKTPGATDPEGERGPTVSGPASCMGGGYRAQKNEEPEELRDNERSGNGHKVAREEDAISARATAPSSGTLGAHREGEEGRRVSETADLSGCARPGEASSSVANGPSLQASSQSSSGSFTSSLVGRLDAVGPRSTVPADRRGEGRDAAASVVCASPAAPFASSQTEEGFVKAATGDFALTGPSSQASKFPHLGAAGARRGGPERTDASSSSSGSLGRLTQAGSSSEATGDGDEAEKNGHGKGRGQHASAASRSSRLVFGASGEPRLFEEAARPRTGRLGSSGCGGPGDGYTLETQETEGESDAKRGFFSPGGRAGGAAEPSSEDSSSPAAPAFPEGVSPRLEAAGGRPESPQGVERVSSKSGSSDSSDASLLSFRPTSPPAASSASASFQLFPGSASSSVSFSPQSSFLVDPQAAPPYFYLPSSSLKSAGRTPGALRVFSAASLGSAEDLLRMQSDSEGEARSQSLEKEPLDAALLAAFTTSDSESPAQTTGPLSVFRSAPSPWTLPAHRGRGPGHRRWDFALPGPESPWSAVPFPASEEESPRRAPASGRSKCHAFYSLPSEEQAKEIVLAGPTALPRLALPPDEPPTSLDFSSEEEGEEARESRSHGDSEMRREKRSKDESQRSGRREEDGWGVSSGSRRQSAGGHAGESGPWGRETGDAEANGSHAQTRKTWRGDRANPGPGARAPGKEETVRDTVREIVRGTGETVREEVEAPQGSRRTWVEFVGGESFEDDRRELPFLSPGSPPAERRNEELNWNEGADLLGQGRPGRGSGREGERKLDSVSEADREERSSTFSSYESERANGESREQRPHAEDDEETLHAWSVCKNRV
ncbi:hypothetical protein TGMAS_224070 [Toxoplasma gondii MAS]|uniref:BAR domain-containing protein n=1 Tax=Toxoplasma gondii MAS TaxID=943118 RepID=A0A086QZV9_TOXGO|nr:hypothetical protein TGMAS_224070 [Toxoplasma gondii MAS]